MGINLCLQTLSCKDHPDWDWGRHAGDKEFVKLSFDLPTIRSGHDGEYTRPTDFAVWRAAVEKAELPNPGRHEKFLDLLEADENYWIYVSY